MPDSIQEDASRAAPERSRPVFLTAEWREIAILSFEVDPAILEPHLPQGTEIDVCGGRCLLSLVGLLFRRTRLLRIPIPFHTSFEEVNLRFYVRRKAGPAQRSGVVFIREMVPRRAVAAVARISYGERYTARRLRHSIAEGVAAGAPFRRVSYGWDTGGKPSGVRLACSGEPLPIAAGTVEEFLADRRWGYVRRRGRTLEYAVDHPKWRILAATEAAVEGDPRETYGDALGSILMGQPLGAFLAEGSEVAIRWPKTLT